MRRACFECVYGIVVSSQSKAGIRLPPPHRVVVRHDAAEQPREAIGLVVIVRFPRKGKAAMQLRQYFVHDALRRQIPWSILKIASAACSAASGLASICDLAKSRSFWRETRDGPVAPFGGIAEFAGTDDRIDGALMAADGLELASEQKMRGRLGRRHRHEPPQEPGGFGMAFQAAFELCELLQFRRMERVDLQDLPVGRPRTVEVTIGHALLRIVQVGFDQPSQAPYAAIIPRPDEHKSPQRSGLIEFVSQLLGLAAPDR